MRARTARLAGVVAAAATLLSPNALAAPTGVTTTVAGLGRVTEVDLVGRGPGGLVVLEPGMDPAAVAAVAYGIGANVPQTSDLTRYGLATRAASRSTAGTVPVLRTSRGLVVAGEPGQPTSGSTVGHVLPRSSSERLVAVRSAATSADPTVVRSNADAGGSVWTWTHRGFQYVNTTDNGRQMQAALFVETGGRVHNPTEAGDMWSSQQQPRTMRHGSPVASISTTGTTQSTRAIPLEWDPTSVSPHGGPYTPVLWQDVRLGKDLTLDWGGRSGVARYRTVLTLPQSTFGHLELPTVYLRGELVSLFGVDAVHGTVTPLTPPDYDPLRPAFDGLDYAPASGRGGVVAATRDGRYAMGLYGVTTAAGGPVTTFTVHDFVPSEAWQLVDGFGNGQYDFSTTKLRALRSATFAAGTTTFDSYVATGTVDEVVAHMRWLTTRAGGA